MVNQQSGCSGSVVVSTASEDIGNPVVSGHSLFGFILSHWEVLAEKITYVVLPAF
ncbi:MAG: hypothetical protein Q8R67_16295 [Rhodoferax sp.]|nr:hypothetical protein [Rhodoferax sp.]MDP3653238.1 hypothetical protein [Rhodoferax sp.]